MNNEGGEYAYIIKCEIFEISFCCISFTLYHYMHNQMSCEKVMYSVMQIIGWMVDHNYRRIIKWKWKKIIICFNSNILSCKVVFCHGMDKEEDC